MEPQINLQKHSGIQVQFRVPAGHRIYSVFPRGQAALELMARSIFGDFKRFKIPAVFSQHEGTLEDGRMFLSTPQPQLAIDELQAELKLCDLLEFVTIQLCEVEVKTTVTEIVPA